MGSLPSLSLPRSLREPNVTQLPVTALRDYYLLTFGTSTAAWALSFVFLKRANSRDAHALSDSQSKLMEKRVQNQKEKFAMMRMISGVMPMAAAIGVDYFYRRFRAKPRGGGEQMATASPLNLLGTATQLGSMNKSRMLLTAAILPLLCGVLPSKVHKLFRQRRKSTAADSEEKQREEEEKEKETSNDKTGLLTYYLLSIGGTICDDIGWRGFAQPQLNAHFGEDMGALISAALMSLWQLPVVVNSIEYHYGSDSKLNTTVKTGRTMSGFFFAFTAVSMYMNLIQRKLAPAPYSVVPSVLAHSAFNTGVMLAFKNLKGSTPHRSDREAEAEAKARRSAAELEEDFYEYDASAKKTLPVDIFKQRHVMWAFAAVWALPLIFSHIRDARNTQKAEAQ